MTLEDRTQPAELLERTAAYAARYLARLDERPVAAQASVAELRAALARPLGEAGLKPEQVIDELVATVEPGLLATSGGRFFGWVIGGTLPAALAADWLTSTWDQNAAIVATSPAAAVVEEVVGTWLKQLLPIPAEASFAFVTGSQMGHLTALATARHHLLATRGWDVEARGLAGAPPIRLIASELRHESIERAIRLLGMGTDSITRIPADASGRLPLDVLHEAFETAGDAPAILCLQAGELSSGAFDDFPGACQLARRYGAWTHVDGAFGLWAAASPRLAHLLTGVELADSWVTDAHKWLNTPFDTGFAFTRHPRAHEGALKTGASYFSHDAVARDQMNWNPEWSRRARGFAVYAALASLGTQGVAELVERCVDRTRALVDGIGALGQTEVLVAPVINQAVVRFLGADADHDARTEAVIAHVQQSGEAWFGPTSWRGNRAMRISVCSWRTSEADVERTVAAVRSALEATSGERGSRRRSADMP
jgi:glutamate/tyrosine decarboxylase-like PLP-dependent enzyme